MHKQWASRHGPSNYDFSEKEPTDSPEDCKRKIRRDPATDYTPSAVICEPFCRLLRGKRFEQSLEFDELYDLVVGLSQIQAGSGSNLSSACNCPRVHIAFPAASSLTASKDFVTWSAGEILSSDDEKTATILESDPMTNVVRSVNA